MEKSIKKAAEQAAASLWIDKLPLSKEYVNNYIINKQKSIKREIVYILRKGKMKNE